MKWFVSNIDVRQLRVSKRRAAQNQFYKQKETESQETLSSRALLFLKLISSL